jgi:hypothetical protein
MSYWYQVIEIPSEIDRNVTLPPDFLRDEMEAYANNETKLRRTHEGMYVAIKGSEILDACENISDALAKAYSKYGYVDILIKKIGESEKSITNY